MNEVSFSPVGSVADAIDAMQGIASRLPPRDGVAAFNRMYLEVTQAVATCIQDGFFANSTFLDRLDIAFANHYLGAVARAEAGAEVPRCWRVLWQQRDAQDREPIQFAVAGMSAHINHDLVLALVETFVELGLTPHDLALLGDYQRVNELLATLENQIRRSYEGSFMLRLERPFGRVEDCVDKWSISRARAAAWHDARGLWTVRGHPQLQVRYERALDEAVALAGRCLLMPVGQHEHHAQAPCMTHEPMMRAFPGQP